MAGQAEGLTALFSRETSESRFFRSAFSRVMRCSAEDTKCDNL